MVATAYTIFIYFHTLFPQHFQNFVSAELAEVKEDVLVSYYLTSIYDHSSLEAFSKVDQSPMRCSHMKFKLIMCYVLLMKIGYPEACGSAPSAEQSDGQLDCMVSSPLF